MAWMASGEDSIFSRRESGPQALADEETVGHDLTMGANFCSSQKEQNKRHTVSTCNKSKHLSYSQSFTRKGKLWTF